MLVKILLPLILISVLLFSSAFLFYIKVLLFSCLHHLFLSIFLLLPLSYTDTTSLSCPTFAISCFLYSTIACQFFKCLLVLLLIWFFKKLQLSGSCYCSCDSTFYLCSQKLDQQSGPAQGPKLSESGGRCMFVYWPL